MSLDLEKLNIIIEGSADNAANSIDKLIGSLSELRTAAGNLSGIGNATKQALNSTAKAAGDLTGSTEHAARSAETTAEALDDTKEKAKEQAAAFREASRVIREYYSVLNKFERSKTDIEWLKSPIGTQATSPSGKWSGMARSLTEVTEAYQDLSYIKGDLTEEQLSSLEALEDMLGRNYSITIDQVANRSEKAAKAVKELGRQAHGTTSKIGNLWNSIKRIAFYRLIRAAIREVTQAFSEGVSIFVEWDRTYNNGMAGAAKTTDELKAKWRETEKAIGAAVMPLIQAAKPALDWLMNATINLFNYIQQVVRALRGESQWYRAVYKEAEATTGAAKELRRVLFGFDELNVLPSQSGNGASSEIGKWEYVLEDIPDKAELAEKGIKGLIAALLGGGFISGLKGIIDLFNRKNKSLETQSQRTQTETGKVTALSAAFASALAAGGAFASWLLREKLQVQVQKPVLDFSDYRSAIDAMGHYAANPGIVVKTSADLTGYANVIQSQFATQSALNAAPLTISTTMLMSGAANALASGLSSLQAQLNANPLYIPTVMQDEVTGTRSTYFHMTAADSMYADASALVNLQNQFAAAEASRNMTATDYINYAESTGLNLSEADKQALKYTVAGILTPMAAVPLVTASPALAPLLAPILGFASGGDPLAGTLFWAGENNKAEVVANTPGGTGVMNMQQMQQAVSNGNLQVVNALGVMANLIVQAIEQKPTDLYIDGDAVGRAATRYQNGRLRATGVPVTARG